MLAVPCPKISLTLRAKSDGLLVKSAPFRVRSATFSQLCTLFVSNLHLALDPAGEPKLTKHQTYPRGLRFDSRTGTWVVDIMWLGAAS